MARWIFVVLEAAEPVNIRADLFRITRSDDMVVVDSRSTRTLLRAQELVESYGYSRRY